MADSNRQNQQEKRNPADNFSKEDRSKGDSMSGGNFKNDPNRAREAGKKGGNSR